MHIVKVAKQKDKNGQLFFQSCFLTYITHTYIIRVETMIHHCTLVSELYTTLYAVCTNLNLVGAILRTPHRTSPSSFRESQWNLRKSFNKILVKL